jgi:hypothetical protein
MKFLQSLFHWDADQGLFEKLLTVVLALFGITLIMVLVLSSYGVFDNYLSQSARAAGAGVKLLGTVVLAGTVFWGYINFSEKVPFKVNDMAFIVSLLILLVLVININCGFRFNFA